MYTGNGQKIFIFKEKYGEHAYLVKSTEDYLKLGRNIIKERLNDGYYVGEDSRIRKTAEDIIEGRTGYHPWNFLSDRKYAEYEGWDEYYVEDI